MKKFTDYSKKALKESNILTNEQLNFISEIIYDGE